MNLLVVHQNYEKSMCFYCNNSQVMLHRFSMECVRESRSGLRYPFDKYYATDGHYLCRIVSICTVQLRHLKTILPSLRNPIYTQWSLVPITCHNHSVSQYKLATFPVDTDQSNRFDHPLAKPSQTPYDYKLQHTTRLELTQFQLEHSKLEAVYIITKEEKNV